MWFYMTSFRQVKLDFFRPITSYDPVDGADLRSLWHHQSLPTPQLFGILSISYQNWQNNWKTVVFHRFVILSLILGSHLLRFFVIVWGHLWFFVVHQNMLVYDLAKKCANFSCIFSDSLRNSPQRSSKLHLHGGCNQELFNLSWHESGAVAGKVERDSWFSSHPASR